MSKLKLTDDELVDLMVKAQRRNDFKVQRALAELADLRRATNWNALEEDKPELPPDVDLLALRLDAQGCNLLTREERRQLIDRVLTTVAWLTHRCMAWRARAVKAEQAIYRALETSNGRWSEWGERALAVLDHLEQITLGAEAKLEDDEPDDE